ncbi:MAG: hypothetical protein V1682_00135 [Candidatus Omnitrophota bacterium]
MINVGTFGKDNKLDAAAFATTLARANNIWANNQAQITKTANVIKTADIILTKAQVFMAMMMGMNTVTVQLANGNMAIVPIGTADSSKMTTNDAMALMSQEAATMYSAVDRIIHKFEKKPEGGYAEVIKNEILSTPTAYQKRLADVTQVKDVTITVKGGGGMNQKAAEELAKSSGIQAGSTTLLMDATGKVLYSATAKDAANGKYLDIGSSTDKFLRFVDVRAGVATIKMSDAVDTANRGWMAGLFSVSGAATGLAIALALAPETLGSSLAVWGIGIAIGALIGAGTGYTAGGKFMSWSQARRIEAGGWRAEQAVSEAQFMISHPILDALYNASNTVFGKVLFEAANIGVCATNYLSWGLAATGGAFAMHDKSGLKPYEAYIYVGFMVAELTLTLGLSGGIKAMVQSLGRQVVTRLATAAVATLAYSAYGLATDSFSYSVAGLIFAGGYLMGGGVKELIGAFRFTQAPKVAGALAAGVVDKASGFMARFGKEFFNGWRGIIYDVTEGTTSLFTRAARAMGAIVEHTFNFERMAQARNAAVGWMLGYTGWTGALSLVSGKKLYSSDAMFTAGRAAFFMSLASTTVAGLNFKQVMMGAAVGARTMPLIGGWIDKASRALASINVRGFYIFGKGKTAFEAAATRWAMVFSIEGAAYTTFSIGVMMNVMLTGIGQFTRPLVESRGYTEKNIQTIDGWFKKQVVGMMYQFGNPSIMGSIKENFSLSFILFFHFLGPFAGALGGGFGKAAKVVNETSNAGLLYLAGGGGLVLLNYATKMGRGIGNVLKFVTGGAEGSLVSRGLGSIYEEGIKEPFIGMGLRFAGVSDNVAEYIVEFFDVNGSSRHGARFDTAQSATAQFVGSVDSAGGMASFASAVQAAGMSQAGIALLWQVHGYASAGDYDVAAYTMTKLLTGADTDAGALAGMAAGDGLFAGVAAMLQDLHSAVGRNLLMGQKLEGITETDMDDFNTLGLDESFKGLGAAGLNALGQFIAGNPMALINVNDLASSGNVVAAAVIANIEKEGQRSNMLAGLGLSDGFRDIISGMTPEGRAALATALASNGLASARAKIDDIVANALFSIAVRAESVNKGLLKKLGASPEFIKAVININQDARDDIARGLLSRMGSMHAGMLAEEAAMLVVSSMIKYDIDNLGRVLSLLNDSHGLAKEVDEAVQEMMDYGMTMESIADAISYQAGAFTLNRAPGNIRRAAMASMLYSGNENAFRMLKDIGVNGIVITSLKENSMAPDRRFVQTVAAAIRDTMISSDLNIEDEDISRAIERIAIANAPTPELQKWLIRGVLPGERADRLIKMIEALVATPEGGSSYAAAMAVFAKTFNAFSSTGNYHFATLMERALLMTGSESLLKFFTNNELAETGRNGAARAITRSRGDAQVLSVLKAYGILVTAGDEAAIKATFRANADRDNSALRKGLSDIIGEEPADSMISDLDSVKGDAQRMDAVYTKMAKAINKEISQSVTTFGREDGLADNRQLFRKGRAEKTADALKSLGLYEMFAPSEDDLAKAKAYLGLKHSILSEVSGYMPMLLSSPGLSAGMRSFLQERNEEFSALSSMTRRMDTIDKLTAAELETLKGIIGNRAIDLALDDNVPAIVKFILADTRPQGQAFNMETGKLEYAERMLIGKLASRELTRAEAFSARTQARMSSGALNVARKWASDTREAIQSREPIKEITADSWITKPIVSVMNWLAKRDFEKTLYLKGDALRKYTDIWSARETRYQKWQHRLAGVLATATGAQQIFDEKYVSRVIQASGELKKKYGDEADPSKKTGIFLEAVSAMTPEAKGRYIAELEKNTEDWMKLGAYTRMNRGGYTNEQALAAIMMGIALADGKVPYLEQLLAASVMIKGNKIAELATGEGKTLVGWMVNYVRALSGKGVVSVSSNSQLARDSYYGKDSIDESSGELKHEAGAIDVLEKVMGMNLGLITDTTSESERKANYQGIEGRKAHVVYADFRQLSFDVIHDMFTITNGMKDARYIRSEQSGLKEMFMTFDEIDSGLIDQALTSFIMVSGKTTISLTEKIKIMVAYAAQKKLEEDNLIQGTERVATDRKGVTATDDSRHLLIYNRTDDSIRIAKGKEASLAGIFRSAFKDEDGPVKKSVVEALERQGIDSEEKILAAFDAVAKEVEKEFNTPEVEREKYIKKAAGDMKKAAEASLRYRRNIGYAIRHGQIILVSDTTGYTQEGQRLQDNLHQFLEAKELFEQSDSTPGLDIHGDSLPDKSLSAREVLKFFGQVSGMTGTATSLIDDVRLFKDIYGLEVVNIARHDIFNRADLRMEIYITESARMAELRVRIAEAQEKDRPILIQVMDMRQADALAQEMALWGYEEFRDGMPEGGNYFQVYDARNERRASDFVRNAGKKKMITIATAVSGRGTDITPLLFKEYSEQAEKLEREGNQSEAAQYKEKGARYKGLLAISLGFHDNVRVKNQFAGRAGRNGKNGEFMEMTLFAKDSSDLNKLKKANSIYAQGHLDFSKHLMSQAIKIVEDAQAKREELKEDKDIELVRNAVRAAQKILGEASVALIRSQMAFNEQLFNYQLRMRDVRDKMDGSLPVFGTTPAAIEAVVNEVTGNATQNGQLDYDMLSQLVREATGLPISAEELKDGGVDRLTKYLVGHYTRQAQDKLIEEASRKFFGEAEAIRRNERQSKNLNTAFKDAYKIFLNAINSVHMDVSYVSTFAAEEMADVADRRSITRTQAIIKDSSVTAVESMLGVKLTDDAAFGRAIEAARNITGDAERGSLAKHIDIAIVALQELVKYDSENRTAHEKMAQNMEKLFDVVSDRDKVEGPAETSVSDIAGREEVRRTILQKVFGLGPRTAYAGYAYRSANVMQAQRASSLNLTAEEKADIKAGVTAASRTAEREVSKGISEARTKLELARRDAVENFDRERETAAKLAMDELMRVKVENGIATDPVTGRQMPVANFIKDFEARMYARGIFSDITIYTQVNLFDRLGYWFGMKGKVIFIPPAEAEKLGQYFVQNNVPLFKQLYLGLMLNITGRDHETNLLELNDDRIILNKAYGILSSYSADELDALRMRSNNVLANLGTFRGATAQDTDKKLELAMTLVFGQQVGDAPYTETQAKLQALSRFMAESPLADRLVKDGKATAGKDLYKLLREVEAAHALQARSDVTANELKAFGLISDEAHQMLSTEPVSRSRGIKTLYFGISDYMKTDLEKTRPAVRVIAPIVGMLSLGAIVSPIAGSLTIGTSAMIVAMGLLPMISKMLPKTGKTAGITKASGQISLLSSGLALIFQAKIVGAIGFVGSKLWEFAGPVVVFTGINYLVKGVTALVKRINNGYEDRAAIELLGQIPQGEASKERAVVDGRALFQDVLKRSGEEGRAMQPTIADIEAQAALKGIAPNADGSASPEIVVAINEAIRFISMISGESVPEDIDKMTSKMVDILNSIPRAADPANDMRNAITVQMLYGTAQDNPADTAAAHIALVGYTLFRSTLKPAKEEGMVILPTVSEVEFKVDEAGLPKDEPENPSIERTKVRTAIYAGIARMMAGKDAEKLSKLQLHEIGSHMAEIAVALPQPMFERVHTGMLYETALSQPDIGQAIKNLEDGIVIQDLMKAREAAAQAEPAPALVEAAPPAEPEAPAEGGQIAKGWLKDRTEEVKSVQDAFDMRDENNKELISRVEPGKEVVEAVEAAVNSLLEDISRFETSPPAGISREELAKAKGILMARAINYFTARVEPKEGHLLGFGKKDGIAIAPDVISYLLTRTDLTADTNRLVQEYILHEVLEAVTPVNTHDRLYQTAQNDFFKGTGGYDVDKNPLGLALGAFNDKERIAASLQGKGISAAAISEMAAIYGMANSGIAFKDDMPFTIELDGIRYDVALAKGMDIKEALIGFVGAPDNMESVAPEVKTEILKTIAGYAGALRYEVAFAVGQDGKIAYYTDRSVMAFKADGKGYDFKSVNKFDMNNTRWLVHSHPVMPAGDEEFAIDRANAGTIGNAGSMVLLPDGSIKVLKMPAAPLAALQKPEMGAANYAFTYSGRAYTGERAQVASAYTLIEGILRQDIASVSVADLFNAVRKLHEAGISSDTVILAFDGKSVVDMTTGKLRNVEFRKALEAKENENVARVVLIARTPAEQDFLTANMPKVSVVLVNDGDKPSEKIADAMRARGVTVGNVAVLLGDTGREIGMIGADAESARNTNREGTLAYALINSADTKAANVPVEKINLANLLASIAMRGAFVAIGYNESDKGIQSLSGYFGFFKIFRNVTEALGRMLEAMRAAAKSA